MAIMLSMKYLKYTNQLIVLLTILVLTHTQTYNTSICNTFWFNGVYYTVNTKYTDTNAEDNNINVIYNFCHQLEYYCQGTRQVLLASLVQRVGNQCYHYQQNRIELINSKNLSQGIKVIYQWPKGRDKIPNVNSSLQIQFPCKGSGSGCPDVERSTIFTYFQDNELGFMIAMEIIGAIFMVFGLYIYRASIVLLGACTMFFILLAIQLPIIFNPGVPHELLSNVLIISGICSFFAGYVFGYFPKVGVFMLGGWIGLIISLTLNNIAFYYIPSNPANLTLWIVMPILCVLFGILSLFIKKTFIIFATSLIGAYMCLRALSWYLGAFPNEFLLARKFHLGLVGPVSWQFYLYVIALVILTASSSALQYWLFTKKSEITNQPKNIDEEFGEMQADMKAKRQDLGQIANFKQIFKKGKGNPPKVLKKVSGSGSERQQSEENQVSEKDLADLSEVSQEKPVISKKDLRKKFIIK